MRLWSRIAVVMAFVPLVASAQFKDLDAALQSLRVGFGSGDPQAVAAGVAPGDRVMLQFPGLIEQSGFFGRDQAAYLLDGLFSKVHPTAFEVRSARKVSAKGQYQITGSWTIQPGGKPDTRELYITLRKQGNEWALALVISSGE